MKTIAVLIPTYQPKEYFKRCLDSIQNQTLSKDCFCVYIALNGPNKPYEEYIFGILKKMKFSYKYIYLEEAGVSNARNKLLDCSEEEFITFIDDDDLITENYLQNLLDVSTDKYIGVSNIYYFQTDIEHLEKNYIGSDFESLDKVETSKFKTRKYFSSSCAKVIHRTMIGRTRFDINLKNGEDSLFMATISKNIIAVCKTTRETCYYVYQRPNSAQSKKRGLYNKITNSIYLLKEYSKLFFTKDYEKIFIFTRMIATLKKFIKDL